MATASQQRIDPREWLETLAKSPGLDYEGVVPVQARLPSAVEMGELSDADLVALLQRYDILNPYQRQIADAAAYVARMSNIPPGSARFQEEVEQVAELRGLRRLARTAKRDYEMTIATGGRADQVLLRICEDDENSCEVCLSKSGLEATWAEHKAIGTDDCLGGGDCRCTFIPVD